MKRTLVVAATVAVLALAAVSFVFAMPADGTYRGSAEGYKSEIVVEVTVQGGRIASIEVVSHDETVRLAEPIMTQTIDAIVEAQSADVDAKTRATASSKGVIEAVKAALAN